jgi:hypothetical protein
MRGRTIQRIEFVDGQIVRGAAPLPAGSLNRGDRAD